MRPYRLIALFTIAAILCMPAAGYSQVMPSVCPMPPAVCSMASCSLMMPAVQKSCHGSKTMTCCEPSKHPGSAPEGLPASEKEKWTGLNGSLQAVLQERIVVVDRLGSDPILSQDESPQKERTLLESIAELRL